MHMIRFMTELWSLKEKKELSNLIQSLKKTLLKQKRELGLRTTEGKEAMGFATCKLTCQLCMHEGTKESILVLTWLIF